MSFVAPSGRVLTSGDFLDKPVRELMTPGVVAIADSSNLDQVHAALSLYRVHAILVVSDNGTPLGWVTARGLLAFTDRDTDLISAKDAISEEAHNIVFGSTARDAIERLSAADCTHLLVVEEEGDFPVGTISDLDLAAFVAHR